MSSDNIKPLKIPANWTFKTPEVAAAFDKHVREQLPWYDLATGVIAHVGRHYVPENGTIVDIGASTGNVGRALAKTIELRKAKLIAIDNSESMANAYSGPGALQICDARSFDYAAAEPDLIVAFLVLMFVPVPDRATLVERMKTAVRRGGAVLVFDKLSPRAGYIGAVTYRLTLAAKYEAGASPEEVIEKELSLAGVQRPMSESELDGFAPIFRFGDFGGFLWESSP